MKHTDDKDFAQKLVPLLDAIFREVADRRREVRLLEKQLATATREGDDDQLTELRAKLATHRRELRLSRKEFERLGCEVDESNPNRVLILGSNGRRAYRWDAGDVAVHRVLSDAGRSA